MENYSQALRPKHARNKSNAMHIIEQDVTP